MRIIPLLQENDRHIQQTARLLYESLRQDWPDMDAALREVQDSLGADDKNNRTTLGGVDLYPDPLRHLVSLRSIEDHPFGFYQKLGFAVTGVIPDANNTGKPDIYMAKHIGNLSAETTAR